ncbi:hypothetical protein FQA39_LY03512 [Lamprigera yunnana]|nr:hypothetical protein FQA39_LY03512 [Lamprigera yunnana]
MAIRARSKIDKILVLICITVRVVTVLIGIEEQESGARNIPEGRLTDVDTSLQDGSTECCHYNQELTDVCVGTSIGTITEPDCLGPCEPGTSVTLEGIVWHETEGGVLVVNVTWRGKTYVGTLLDCTRHDWAPPRFCDSPTSDLDSRTPKGRETRSSVHSKLRNGGIKGRRGAANGSGPSTAPSSPTPFVPPRPEPNTKRKNRTGEEEQQANSNSASSKKTKTVPLTTSNSSGSPPPSPILLECPEPNCSKKYKHINGLKYHQSHAHGSADDDDTKDVTSMSENDESNIDAPSPITPVKSPDKSQDSPLTPQKKDDLLRGSGLLEVPSQPGTPRSTPPSPETPQSLPDMTTSVESPTMSLIDTKNVVKASVLRYNTTEEFPMGVFSSNKPHSTGTPMSSVRSVNVTLPTEQINLQQPETNVPLQSFSNQLQSQSISPQVFDQAPTLLMPSQNSQNINQNPTQMSPSEPPSPSESNKITPFKVKPTSALMADDKKERSKLTNYKKKSRKSPAGSPHPPQPEQQVFGMEPSGRDEVQSPAYSDISDDGAPVMEPDLGDKNKSGDKKNETSQPLSHLPQYGMYPFYGQPPYMMPSVQQNQEPKPKEPEKVVEKIPEKEIKKEGSEYQQKVLQQHYYNPYGYVPGYPYNMDPNFGSVPIVQEDKAKEERIKESPSPADHNPKQSAPIPNPIQVPTPGKLKNEISLKEKQQNENHQILKESIEIKTQMSPYIYSRQSQSQHAQREEDMRRFYGYSEQRRKEQPMESKNPINKVPPPSVPTLKPKEKIEEKKEKEIKHEGVKPTMETQGPPPPPTSQYAYIHPSYMQSPHYGALPFDPNHPMYRGIMVPGPYSGNPYMHPQLPRYHAPEDLSRPPPPSKTLDMLQHHAQYYSSHKIHELQERAIKSPTPKTSVASSSPSGSTGSTPGQTQNQMMGCVTSQPSGTLAIGGKQTPGENKESRSPPPQRHVHTHHHTHVGLGYPMYPAPYGGYYSDVGLDFLSGTHSTRASDLKSRLLDGLVFVLQGLRLNGTASTIAVFLLMRYRTDWSCLEFTLMCELGYWCDVDGVVCVENG